MVSSEKASSSVVRGDVATGQVLTEDGTTTI